MPNERTKSFLINYDLLQLMGTGVFFYFSVLRQLPSSRDIKIVSNWFYTIVM